MNPGEGVYAFAALRDSRATMVSAIPPGSIRRRAADDPGGDEYLSADRATVAKTVGRMWFRTRGGLVFGGGRPLAIPCAPFQNAGERPPEVFLTDKYPNTTKLHDLESLTANRIHFLRHSIDATQIPGHLQGFRTLFSCFHHLNHDEARRLLQDSC